MGSLSSFELTVLQTLYMYVSGNVGAEACIGCTISRKRHPQHIGTHCILSWEAAVEGAWMELKGDLEVGSGRGRHVARHFARVYDGAPMPRGEACKAMVSITRKRKRC